MCTGLPIGVACRQTPVAATICRLSVARYRSCARFLARFPAAFGPGCGLASHDANEAFGVRCDASRSEEHTSELQSLMRISYAVFCLNKKNKINKQHSTCI